MRSQQYQLEDNFQLCKQEKKMREKKKIKRGGCRKRNSYQLPPLRINIHIPFVFRTYSCICWIDFLFSFGGHKR